MCPTKHFVYIFFNPVFQLSTAKNEINLFNNHILIVAPVTFAPAGEMTPSAEFLYDIPPAMVQISGASIVYSMWVMSCKKSAFKHAWIQIILCITKVSGLLLSIYSVVANDYVSGQ